MNTHADKTQESKSQFVTKTIPQNTNSSKSAFQFVDNRPEAVAQQKIEDMANNSPQVKQAVQFQAIADNYTRRQLQSIQKKENKTGLPDNLKSSIENFSGYSMDDVKVHYNSDKPAQLQAHAYAQGTDIHLGSGQEKHLPHEAWHVVQQKQGRVKPTMQMKGNVRINDDPGLEKEADVMGHKAYQFKDDLLEVHLPSKLQEIKNNLSQSKEVSQLEAVVQRGQGASKTATALSSLAPKKTYLSKQLTNTTLANIIKGKLLKSSVVTHGTHAPRTILKGETDPAKKTNTGTTGELVHFLPSWRNDYGSFVYVFDKNKLGGQSRGGDFVVHGTVDTDKSEGFYTASQLKDVEVRILKDEDLELEKE